MARARTRRFTPSASARRRRVWARSSSEITGITGATPGVVDVLSQFRAAAAQLPMGVTIGGVKLHLRGARTAGSENNPGIVWGLRVDNLTADPDDLNPADFTGAAGAHADWMMWTFFSVAASPDLHQERFDIRSMRRMDEVGQTLFFACFASIGDTYDIGVTASTLLLLP